jgi:beta-glucosidase-like glycosyl hydrolase
MVDIALDARWGRIMEGNGEDPYLGSLVAAALVRGYQGDFKGRHNILACLKHYALYGAAEAGRDYNTVDMSHLRMFNQYFPPYEAAVKAGVGSVMTSFNIVDGQHATANPWLIDEVLRQKWGFKGFVETDYFGVYGYMSADQAVRNGTDLMLVNYPTATNNVQFRDTNGAQKAMREAAHNCLYTVVNSRAYAPENLNPGMPTWNKALIAADVVLGALGCFLVWQLVKNYKKRVAEGK